MKTEISNFSSLKEFNIGMNGNGINGNGIMVNESEIKIELDKLLELSK